MKRIIALLILLVVCVVACAAATRWSVGRYVDAFGDQTDEVYISSEAVVLNPEPYVTARCFIIIDSSTVSLELNNKYHDDWKIMTKLPDGKTRTYDGTLNGNGRVYLKNRDTRDFIGDLIKKCKLVVYPDNKYSNRKYNFGEMSMNGELLLLVRPEMGTELGTN